MRKREVCSELLQRLDELEASLREQAIHRSRISGLKPNEQLESEAADAIAQLRSALEAVEKERDWAEREVLEIMRVVGPGDGTDDDIIRLMKLTAIRRLVEADEEKYTALADKWMEPDALRKETE